MRSVLTLAVFGANSGVRTLLVMGGVTAKDQIYGDNPSEIVPTYVMESLGDMAVLAEKAN